MASPRLGGRPARSLRLVVQFPRLGPYHAARLEAAAGRGEVLALESAPGGDEYLWESAARPERFTRERLAEEERGLPAAVARALARLQPDVVALCGWSDPAALAGLRFCLGSGTPAILMSDSLPASSERRWRRALRSRVVRLFGAALVGGAAHADYLVALGLPRERIFTGYDVVDNEHFARGADAARRGADSARQERGLPARYFLACQRLIAEKNIPGLLEAFALYRRRAGADAWSLVVAGDGPLRLELSRLVRESGLQAEVRLTGAVGYTELPALYGLAGALVHASVSDTWGLVVNEAMAAALPVLVSRRCGCAAELVREGENGFTFDPDDAKGLAGLLQQMAEEPRERREALGRAGRAAIAAWSPDAFASGLWSAAASADRRRADRISDALLRALASR